jgi:hypothetical protein
VAAVVNLAVVLAVWVAEALLQHVKVVAETAAIAGTALLELQALAVVAVVRGLLPALLPPHF